MDKLEKNIVLNALIHDLGKFYMRTHSEEECYGSVSGKKLTHEELLDRVKREASLEVERLDPVYEDFCRVADWIVAQEREDLEDDKDRRKIDIRKEPLISIFSIFTDRESERVKPGKLELSLPSKYSIEDTHKDENIFEPNLYKDFINDLKKILQNKNTDFELLIRCMLDLYRKHLSKIPSASYYSKPTIDLYNHSKLTAAIAISLYRYYKNDRTSFENLKSVLGKIFATIKENTNKEIAPEYLGDKYYTQKFLLLVNGDLSGIQDFIATIHTSDARKMLKARSFYITFLPRIFSLKILKELDLPETNLLFCSGGNFQIICDNTEETKKKIIQTFDELNRELFRNFGSRLFFALKYLELSAKSFREFNNEMENNNWNLIFDKHRKFEFLLREGNIELEAGRDECVICKKEIYVDSPEKICKSCNTLRKLD
ncbi:MAG: type III-A CRISPR-associated protein Cas10/Csm1, partial [Candidatus Aenigmatarchaeota archaeon]